MKFIQTLGLLLLLCSPLPAQNAFSVELNPHFVVVQSNVEDVPSYLLLNPIIQVNYRIGAYLEPYLRAGRAFASGDDITPSTHQEYGVGTRLYFDHLIPFKNEWTVKRVDLFGFFDYALTDYGLTTDLLPIPTTFGNGQIMRTGVGMTIRVGKRLGVGFNVGFINHSVDNTANYQFLRSLRVGYHFNKLESGR